MPENLKTGGKIKQRSTDELFYIFRNSENVSEDVDRCFFNQPEPDLPKLFKDLLEKYGKTVDDVCDSAMISRSYAYQIQSGLRVPTDDVIILIALGLGFSLNDTQLLLKYAKRAQLYPKFRRDAIIISCVSNGSGVEECNRLLREKGLKELI